MSTHFSRAPHIEGAGSKAHPAQAPNAALLIDFDNVTMGMRSDLSKELNTLLNSDVIKGKVTVQRAYADWRRYPQYVAPLSEASIDLIFAPAYGSNKKNATDIRMAIDGMELVFTRPEIGTFILLTGDSDFSSLVLKLKEYGKYVIGVGMQESSSDILVQNCDEYYSYTSLSGLRKSDSGDAGSSDPWDLAKQAVAQMGRRGDVMRSDRLKQVMLEIDSAFDEKSLGFSKFSRFVSQAAQRGVLQTRRMDNGQYEIMPGKGGAAERSDSGSDRSSGRGGRQGRGGRGGRDRQGRDAPGRSAESSESPASGESSDVPVTADLTSAYDLLRKAITDLLEDQDSDAVRDSDVKRRILAIDRTFDESNLGFPKFSRFLRQAHDHGVVDLRKLEAGNFEVALGRVDGTAAGGSAKDAADGPAGVSVASDASDALPPELLRLPTDPESTVKYLTNSYSGVGEKTAEALVDALGADLFRVLQSDPERVRKILPPLRADKVLEGWQADYERRRSRHAAEASPSVGRASGVARPSASRAGGGGNDRQEQADPGDADRGDADRGDARAAEVSVADAVGTPDSTDTLTTTATQPTRLRRGRRTRGSLLTED